MKPHEVYELACELERDLTQVLQDIWDRRIDIVDTMKKLDDARKKSANLNFEIAKTLQDVL